MKLCSWLMVAVTFLSPKKAVLAAVVYLQDYAQVSRLGIFFSNEDF